MKSVDHQISMVIRSFIRESNVALGRYRISLVLRPVFSIFHHHKTKMEKSGLGTRLDRYVALVINHMQK